MLQTDGRVVSVNVSDARTVDAAGKAVTTGIFKRPVSGPVPLHGVNLAGDEQADRAVHGGPDRVIYAYADEDYQWWSQTRNRTFAPGSFGENLTTLGVDVTKALVGEQWRVGSARLRVTSPRVPCYKLALAMNDSGFVKAFAQALRPGAYLAVEAEGVIAAGDPVRVEWRPAHSLTVGEMANITLFERSRLREMLDVAELPASWREWVLEQEALRG